MKNRLMMFRIYSILAILFIVIIGCGGSSTVPPPPTGSISGTVSVVSGVTIENVAASLTQVSTGATWSTKTDINGYYIFPYLPDGIYILRYSKPNYVTFNIYTIVSGGLHKDVSGNLLTSDEISFFFGPAHRFNSQYGLVGTYVRTSRYAGLSGATVSISPSAGTYDALGYQDMDYTFNWSATSTLIGYAMFYNVGGGRVC